MNISAPNHGTPSAKSGWQKIGIPVRIAVEAASLSTSTIKPTTDLAESE
jgi:hypothetical protein